MALYGHTKIELTDVKSGEKKIIEKHNMVTNAYKRVLEAKARLVPFVGTTQNSVTFGVDQFMKGISLFDQPLVEDAENFIFPVDNHVIAHAGSNTSIDPLDTTKGIYNTNLSSSTNKSRTYVWDFDAEHGNGTIASLALVPSRCGDGNLPCGSDSTPSSTNYIDLISKPGSSSDAITPNSTIHTGLDANYWAAYLSVERDAVYLANFRTANKVVIVKRPLGSKNRSYFDSLNFTSTMTNLGAGLSGTKTLTVDISQYGTGSYSRMGFANGKIYIFALSTSASWANSTAKTLLIIDLETGNIETKNISNLTGSAITLQQHNGGNTWFVPSMGICGNYIIFNTSNNNVYALNINNPSDLKQIFTVDGSALTTSNGNGNFISLGKHVYIGTNGLGTTQANLPMYVISPTDGKAYKINLRFVNSNICSYPSTYASFGPSDVDYIYFTFSGSGTSFYTTFFVKNMLLATINNLDAPVIKTADQTMRITYTLTEEE